MGLPLNALQKALAARLVAAIAPTPVYDLALEGQPFPYVIVGEVVFNESERFQSKVKDAFDVSADVEIYSAVDGYKEANAIADTIYADLDGAELDLTSDGFCESFRGLGRVTTRPAFFQGLLIRVVTITYEYSITEV